MIPISSLLTKQDSVTERLLGTLIKLTVSDTVSRDRMIPAMTALYLFWTYGVSSAFSVVGQAISRREGFDFNHPRRHINSLTGLPLRLKSAHDALMGNFVGFAVAASLSQVLAADNPQIVNLLGLHVLMRIFIYYPSYVLNIPPLRTLSHVLSISAIIQVCLRLAKQV